MNNFYIYYDRDGKMPVLTRHKKNIPNHPYWIEYQGNRPIDYYGPKPVMVQDTSGTKIWDYSVNEFIPIDGVRKAG